MKIQFLLLASLLVVVSGCNQSSALENEQVNVQSKQLLREQAHNEESNYLGKPHAPVSMQYQMMGSPRLFEELTIELSFSVEQETELLEVEYTPQDGLGLSRLIRPYVFPNLQKGAVSVASITVKPEKTGLRYINVFASIEVNGQMQTRTFAIPVNIHSAEYSEFKTTVAEGVGAGLDKGMKYQAEQNVISMPASESSNN